MESAGERPLHSRPAGRICMCMAMGDGLKKFFLVRYSIVVVGSSVHGGSRLALLLGRKEQCMHVNRRFELKIDVIEYSYLIVIYNE
jgi:hypothetical protein